jgi:hypothetical protein
LVGDQSDASVGRRLGRSFQSTSLDEQAPDVDCHRQQEEHDHQQDGDDDDDLT